METVNDALKLISKAREMLNDEDNLSYLSKIDELLEQAIEKLAKCSL